jgi:hypothetical protein
VVEADFFDWIIEVDGGLQFIRNRGHARRLEDLGDRIRNVVVAFLGYATALQSAPVGVRITSWPRPPPP